MTLEIQRHLLLFMSVVEFRESLKTNFCHIEPRCHSERSRRIESGGINSVEILMQSTKYQLFKMVIRLVDCIQNEVFRGALY